MHPHRVFAPIRTCLETLARHRPPRTCPGLHSIARTLRRSAAIATAESPRSARADRSAAARRSACAGSRDPRARCPPPDAGRSEERRVADGGVARYVVEIGAEAVPGLADRGIPVEAVVLRHGDGGHCGGDRLRHRGDLEDGGAADLRGCHPGCCEGHSLGQGSSAAMHHRNGEAGKRRCFLDLLNDVRQGGHRLLDAPTRHQPHLSRACLMIHATHLHGSPAKNGGPVPESSRRRGFFAAVAASLSAVHLAKRAADEKPCVRRAGADGAAGDTAAQRAVRGSRGHDRDFITGRTGAHLSEKNVIMADTRVSAGAGVSRLQRGNHPCESGLFI